MQESADYRVGSLVHLRIGGPELIITELDGGYALCQYTTASIRGGWVLAQVDELELRPATDRPHPATGITWH
ncbi:hypothetical protein [Hymenobacter sp. UYP22]|uniref:hypothetical protein n=1 Tax=Hymenobacter sp. UYP22 TaxID=3156348 RepID=UPI00339B105D